MEELEHRPLLRVVRVGEAIVDTVAFVFIVLVGLYAAYSIWYTSSLLDGSFLSDELAMYKPDGHDPTLGDLMAMNEDVRAWITIDGTNIDYPMVQGDDDFEYLNKNVEGEFSLAGAIYLSAANAPDFSDPYNMVYGHHIDGGAMFSDVLKFRDQAFFDSHPEGALWLSDRAMKIEVFACVEADGLDEDIYRDANSVTADELAAFTERIVARATCSRAVDIAAGDSIIALSTCEDAVSYARVLLFGKLVPMSEDEMRAKEAANAEPEEPVVASEKVAAPTMQERIMRYWPLVLLLFAIIVLLIYRFRRR